MKKNLLLALSVWLLTSCNAGIDLPVRPSDSDLQFSDLAKTWDEGMPLGNADCWCPGLAAGFGFTLILGQD